MLRCTTLLLVALAVAPPLQAAENLILLPNQDFEDQELGWSLWPSNSRSVVELDPTVAHSGKQSLRVTAVNSGDRAIVNASTDEFKTEMIYEIAVHIRRDDNVPESAISYFINYRGGEKTEIKQRAFPMKLEKTKQNGWTRWSGLFFVPKDITRWQFCLGVEHTVGRVWFDDIRIEDRGPATELALDVWTYLPIGVQIGSPPMSRFAKHKEANDAVYRMAARYNSLLFASAFAEAELRDVERCCFYADKQPPDDLRKLFGASEEALNTAFQSYAKAFRSGEEADQKAFDAAADELEHATATLRRGLRDAAAAIRPSEPLKLHENLGRQDRSIRALERNGKMNRLLFGAWSPYNWSDFEKPFELEFHSSAPGSPKTYTETDIDLSNITEACDKLEEMGYAGTFGYLMFGIHDSMYAPKWFLEKHKDDPDLFKISWDGLRGRSSGSRHSLDYFHPQVRAFIRDYLGKYARFCKNEPRVLFHETSQEAYMDFGTDKGRRESGYGPSALKAFHAYLKGKYETIEALNKAWGTEYANSEAIEPPPDVYAKPDREMTPLAAEFEAFRDDGYIGYLKLIYDSLKAGDPAKPVVARHSSLLSGINGARIFETCDVLCYHNRAPNMQVLNVYLNSLNRYHKRGLGYMEDFWGTQEERARVSDEIVQRRGLERHIARTCAWGRTLQMKWYAYTAGSYIFTYNGNWFDPRYDVTTMRYCAPALAVAKRKMELLDWVLTHSEIAPSRILVLQPSATMRNHRPSTSRFGAIVGLHGLLYPNGLLYEIVPEEYFEDGRAKFDDFDVVILPQAKDLSADLQTKLSTFAQGGGMLIAFGRPGLRDEITRPSEALIEALRETADAEEWAQVERTWTEADDEETAANGYTAVRCGRGRLVACRSLAQLHTAGGQSDLLKLIADAAPRAAWSADSRFEVVLRITEDGERYLFLLNPDVDSAHTDIVHLAAPFRQAVDVSVPGGHPVRISNEQDGASLKARLGPGECAALYLS